MIERLIYPFILLLGSALFLLFTWLNIPVTLIPSSVFSIVLLVVLCLEKKLPKDDFSGMSKSQISKDAFFTLGLLPLITFLIEIGYVGFRQKLSFISLSSEYSLAWQFVIVLVVSELLFYWYHRFSHEVLWLKKWHWFHHREQKIYWANSGKFHIVDSLLQFSLYFIPIFLLSPAPIVSAAVLTLSAVTGVMEHANIRYETSGYNLLFNTNDLHSIHHSKRQKLANNNYGKITVIFDRLFGTYLLKPQEKKSSCSKAESNISLGYVGK
jgi:sterol desaturase/sphingolipid hydroxylase (fatty acid hydroxylase superfamily)